MKQLIKYGERTIDMLPNKMDFMRRKVGSQNNKVIVNMIFVKHVFI